MLLLEHKSFKVTSAGRVLESAAKSSDTTLQSSRENISDSAKMQAIDIQIEDAIDRAIKESLGV